MSRIAWDKPGARRYEVGVDRGVLYLSDGTAVPWNGLTSVSKSSSSDLEPVYYDGVKVQDIVTLGEFVGSISAITYPDALDGLVGLLGVGCGVAVGDQPPKRFSLAYRSMVGDDLKGLGHYKIHLAYNLLAAPADTNHQSTTESPAVMELNWNVTALPEEVILSEDTPLMRPTAYLVIDSRKVDPLLLEVLENLLYGSPAAPPTLPSMAELIALVATWKRLAIRDLGDGTWSATEMIEDSYISEDDPEEGFFIIDSGTATMLDEDTYLIEDVACIGPETFAVEITDNGDGTWTARSSLGAAISVDPDTGEFVLNNVDPSLTGPDMYRISDTYADTL